MLTKLVFQTFWGMFDLSIPKTKPHAAIGVKKCINQKLLFEK
jgi:hypothetical protein